MGKGKFTIPGLCMIKTKTKPATKAGMRLMFGKSVKVAAKPARTIVKAYCVKALKDEIEVLAESKTCDPRHAACGACLACLLVCVHALSAPPGLATEASWVRHPHNSNLYLSGGK